MTEESNSRLSSEEDSAIQTTPSSTGSYKEGNSLEQSLTINDGSNESQNEFQQLPFYLHWSFGRNKEVSVVNLTTSEQCKIFFASSHAGIIYDYKTHKMKLVQGHQNAITSISADSTGRWIVTADGGQDNVYVVWDTGTWLPIHTLFNPHPEYGIHLIGMSPDAKYIITVSKGSEQVVAFWMWTQGKEQPDGTVTLQPHFSRINHIVFNPDKTEHFMLTSNSNVIFMTWENQQLNIITPTLKYKVGHLTESVYQPGTHQALTASSRGTVIVWSDTVYPYSSVTDHQMTNKMLAVKRVRLEEHCINILQVVDNITVTANIYGHIHFYDKLLRILYWCDDFDLGPLISISFHLLPRKNDMTDSLGSESVSEYTESMATPLASHSQEEELDVHSENDEQVYMVVPTDATLQRNPFCIREFIVATKDGQLLLINLLQNKCQNILQKIEGEVTAMDTHALKTHLCVATANGHIFLYNYNTKELLVHNKLDCKDAEVVCYLKYSPSGFFLACGMSNGSLWILNPLLLTPVTNNPIKYDSSAITQIVVSDDSSYIGVKDESKCVSLYQCRNPTGSVIAFMGKQRAHYKPIRDLLFIRQSQYPNDLRFFSLGEDRLLVEYDLNQSEPGRLVILSRDRIEQSAIPLTMLPLPACNDDSFILVANSEYKMNMINDVTKMCRKTSLGPQFGSPVSLMQMFTLNKIEGSRTYLAFACGKHIGIQIFPLDGNPFKSLAIIGHPTQITHMCLSSDKNYLFTTGKSDYNVLMWAVNTRTVDILSLIGGEGLEPYYCLIEGGKKGWLFQEIKENFIYTQIRYFGGENNGKSDSGEHSETSIPVSEVPDLMRTIGFYPTDHEVDAIMHEIRYGKDGETGIQQMFIEFEDFVKLYVNHLPIHNASFDKLKESFKRIADNRNEENPSVSRDNLLFTLMEKGECLPRDLVAEYFRALIFTEEVSEEETAKGEETIPGQTANDQLNTDGFNFIPDVMKLSDFANDILGIASKEYQ